MPRHSALLGLALSLGVAVTVAPLSGLTATTSKTIAAILAIGFGIAAVVYAGWAVYHR